MVNKPFPQDLTPGGATATSGITVGTRFKMTEEAPIHGFYYKALAVMTGLTARLYEVSGNGGGDGTIKAQENDLSCVIGDNFWPIDAQLDLVPGRFYVAAVSIPSGSYGFVNPGALVADPPFTGPTSEYIGIHTPSASPPTTMNITAGESTDAPWNDSMNFYGPGVYYDADALYDPVEFTATRITATQNRLEWAEPVDGGPDGMTIIRALGTYNVDGDGDAFGETGYDPTTVTGMATIATGVSSPYLDDLPTSGDHYTYALIRTGPGA